MRHMIRAIGKALGAFSNVALLLAVFCFSFRFGRLDVALSNLRHLSQVLCGAGGVACSVLGMQLFGGKREKSTGVKPRSNFDTLHWAFVTVFQVSLTCALLSSWRWSASSLVAVTARAAGAVWRGLELGDVLLDRRHQSCSGTVLCGAACDRQVHSSEHVSSRLDGELRHGC